MKATFLIVSSLLATAALAADTKPLLDGNGALPAIAAPGFAEPLDAVWSIAKGSWVPTNGVLTAAELPADKHVAVLHHKVGLSVAVIELDFRLDGSPSIIIGCDGKTHIGRVCISAAALSIAEDSVKPSHTIATLKTPTAPGAWHHLRVEWKADQMAANLDGHELRAQHAFLATPKARSWIAVGKSSAQIRGLKINGVKTAAQP
jgi:hypothetical protein